LSHKRLPFNVAKLIEDFKVGFSNYKEVWQKIISPENWEVIEEVFKKEDKDFIMKKGTWASLLYDLAAAFHHWKGNRRLMVRLMTPFILHR